MVIPKVLIPRFLIVRRRWSSRVTLQGEGGRDLVIACFFLAVAFGIYAATRWSLQTLNANPTLSFVPPAMLLSLILFLLFCMLIISSVISAIGSLFLAEDLDLLLASPLPFRTFFSGKCVSILLMSSWMPFVFIFPLLFAFGQAYGVSARFLIAAPLIMAPYFVLPVAVGIAAATILVNAIPVYRVRAMAILLAAGLFLAVYFVVESFQFKFNSLATSREIFRLMSLISLPAWDRLPSSWAAKALDEILKPRGNNLFLFVFQAYMTALAGLSACYLTVKLLHRPGLTRARNKLRAKTRSTWPGSSILERAFGILPQTYRALVTKELRFVARDASQAVQVLMLLGVSLLYLYQLRLFAAVESFPEGMKWWWKSFLFLANVSMGAFISTAMCTRFVFPSISLEGRSFWVLQASPVPVREIMRLKYWCWFFPIALVSAVFFASGAFAIGADWKIVAVSALFSVIMCWGIVSLALGLGAVFATFDWEHPSQLAAGFGNLIFMLSSIALIFLNMLPAWLYLFTSSAGFDVASPKVLALLFFNAMAVVAINFVSSRAVFERGVRALRT